MFSFSRHKSVVLYRPDLEDVARDFNSARKW